MEKEVKLKVKEILDSGGDLKFASELISNVIRENPLDHENYHLYGIILFQKKEFSLSSLMFEAANAINENIDSLFMASISYLMQDKPRLAELAIKQALYVNKEGTMKLIRSFADQNYVNFLSKNEKEILKVKLDILENSI